MSLNFKGQFNLTGQIKMADGVLPPVIGSYDVRTMSVVASITRPELESITGQNHNSIFWGRFFNNGSKFYWAYRNISANQSFLAEADVGTPYDLSTLSLVQNQATISYVAIDFWGNGGNFILTDSGGSVQRYQDLPTPYSRNGGFITTTRVISDNEVTEDWGGLFVDSGNKFLHSGNRSGTRGIHMYSLSIPYVGGATFLSSYEVAAGTVRSPNINADGTVLTYVNVNDGNLSVKVATLGTPFDLSTVQTIETITSPSSDSHNGIYYDDTGNYATLAVDAFAPRIYVFN